MSVEFSSKSGDVDGDSWNLVAMENRSRYALRYLSSVRWIVAAAVSIGLILLTMILVANNTSAINQWDAKYNNMIYEITKGRDDLREERDQLKIHNSNLSLEMVALLSQYKSVVASRDKLQEEVDRLSLNRTDKACHQGWTKLDDKCYYVSPSGASKTWENSRKDCQERGADLVIMKTQAVLDFIKKSEHITWIGLSRLKENMWKWVDGTTLEDSQFWQAGEPNNYDGEEDCVEISHNNGAWNDAHCGRKFSWACEA